MPPSFITLPLALFLIIFHPSLYLTRPFPAVFPQNPIIMIKTLNLYPNPTKNTEIMSRCRPISPKPETSPNSMTESSSSLSHKIKQSPYLRYLWPQLQANPIRTRKRVLHDHYQQPPNPVAELDESMYNMVTSKGKSS
ncbi:hypothetical protein VNO80_13421 [Phaseolus coccineus]|uniref:Uncharacterized protein n=1 Tax=Phaseolus coccineus TaxID=3886 RepID=A0AAN9N0X5_PHACN